MPATTITIERDRPGFGVRELIRERQREGIALAKQRGVYRGRARSLAAVQVAELCDRASSGVPKTVLAKEYGVSRETVCAYLRAAAAQD